MEQQSRSQMFAQYIIDNNCTIRQAAKWFCISKSTVHNDVSNKLKNYDFELYLKVQRVLKHNFNVKHIRGGMATKVKYLTTKK